MAAKRRRRKSSQGIFTAIILVFILALGTLVWNYVHKDAAAPVSGTDSSTALSGDVLAVHFIDVGQGDCELAVTPNGQTVMIDTGVADEYSKISTVLDSLGIRKLDWLILTHPHADHIGSASKIIDNYAIGTIYMTKEQATTSTYEKLLKSIANKKCAVVFPAPGDVYTLDGTSWTILSPKDLGYKDVNDTSIVARMTYKSSSFLFTGDSSSPSEKDILQFAADKGIDLRSDVLKVGHHGSASASTDDYLAAVRPKYAVISCGTGNSFGHPTKSALDRLFSHGAQILRTDLQGDITVSTDGTNYSVTTQKQADPSALLQPGTGGSSNDANA